MQSQNERRSFFSRNPPFWMFFCDGLLHCIVGYYSVLLWLKKKQKRQEGCGSTNRWKEILEQFVITRQSEECTDIMETVTKANQWESFLLQCLWQRYFYEQARDNHEKKQHPESSMASESELENSSASSTPPSEDYIYNYACVRLSFGMLIRNFHDAVREGDGVRIFRCWKFLLLIYKANKNHKYAFAALHLIAKLLTPQQAKRLVWNRTVNNRGGEGRNISLDLRLEHLVYLLKELLANLGVNLTILAAERCSKALKAVEDLLASVDSQLEVKRPSGRHTVTRSKADFEAIVKELYVRGDVFSNRAEGNREYRCFKHIMGSLWGNLT